MMDWTASNPTALLHVNSGTLAGLALDDTTIPMLQNNTMSILAHENHPSFGHLTLLVFEAVVQVVCVSLPGYIIARLGQLDAEKQKFLANLNMQWFTPCLIFYKLGSQLKRDQLQDLVIIPFIFIIQTLVSYVVSKLVAKVFRLRKRPANFVTAMGVFGNSNSLPISLVISLSQTISGLHWDQVPGDNDDQVGARGILYLLIFQQLGQMLRWSWGYQVLLARKDQYEEYRDDTLEEGRYRDHDSSEVLIPGLDGYTAAEDGSYRDSDSSPDSEVYEPAGRTPVAGTANGSPVESDDEAGVSRKRAPKPLVKINSNSTEPFPTPLGGPNDIMSFPRMHERDDGEESSGIRSYKTQAKQYYQKTTGYLAAMISRLSDRIFEILPRPVQVTLSFIKIYAIRFYHGACEFLNPPLWAMILALPVACIPSLQSLFFEDGSFVNNSVTSAIKSSSGVAVPLILLVLGANLAKNTQKRGDSVDPEEVQIGKKLLIASLISRMLLPMLVMGPLLAITAKYVPISILDDPIFIIVCFLLSGAPSALQLAQICQVNEVYEGVMSKILFQSYVIWILPSTLILVLAALEVVEWAT
ncbi:auxin efflux carrier [Xylariomycetidae sp. FL2044]|nr:auxin efflux carrier [Xylariomycetidae sp. FL2044]